MADEHAPLRQALRARRADVVVPDHLEHGRARVARQQADVVGRQHERGEDQVVEGVPGGAPLAGEQSRRPCTSRSCAAAPGRPGRAGLRRGTSRAGRRTRRARRGRSRRSASRCPRARRPAAGGRRTGSRRTAAATPKTTPDEDRDDRREDRQLRRRRDVRSRGSRRTGWRSWSDSPRSPWRRFVEVAPVLDRHRLVEPVALLERRPPRPGRAAACSPRLAATGSLGTSCVNTNATSVMPRHSRTSAAARRRTKRAKGGAGREGVSREGGRS